MYALQNENPRWPSGVFYSYFWERLNLQAYCLLSKYLSSHLQI